MEMNGQPPSNSNFELQPRKTIALQKAVRDLMMPEVAFQQVNGAIVIGVMIEIKDGMVYPKLNVLTRIPVDGAIQILKDAVKALEASYAKKQDNEPELPLGDAS